MDRIRGVCNRLPLESSVNILSILYSTEGQLRDLRHFSGELPKGAAVVLEPPQGESLSGILKGTSEEQSSHEVPRGQGAQPSSGIASSSHREPGEAALGQKVRKKKKNRGQKRKHWQDLKCKIVAGRNTDTVGGDLDWSSSGDEDRE